MNDKSKDFTYISYKKIINKFSNRLKIFNDILENDDDDFVILRHDVEFDIERALKMAKLENECSVNSIYFIQVCLMLTILFHLKISIELMRLKVLHILVSTFIHPIFKILVGKILKLSLRGKMIISNFTDSDINVFSFHRPPKILLENRTI